MGARVDLPRPGVILAGAIWLAGCIDFVEPDLPERGAPAVVQVTIVVSDTGRLELNGMLAPGLHESGLRRNLSRATLRVAGFDVMPAEVERNGTRRYEFMRAVARDLVAGPVAFEAPVVEGVSAQPGVHWFGALRLDPDTIVVMRGADVRLRTRTDLGTSSPPPDVQQWFLTLDGEQGDFRVSADGPPPDPLLIPAYWIPAGTRVEARLAYIQSVRIGATRDYVGLVTLDVRLRWTLLIR